MRYLRKLVPPGGLVSTLLIGGVLGGLLAPPPSDAVPPELTLLIDGQTTLVTSTGATVVGNSILGAAVACAAADTNLGYTNCYAITTSTTVAYRATNNRLYRIQNAPNATARLRIGDNVGQDHLSLVGVQFVPVNTATQGTAPPTGQRNTLTDWGSPDANTNEIHTLVVKLKNKFNRNVNVNNATKYTGTTPIENTKLPVALRVGGYFTSGIVDTNPVAPSPLYCGPSAIAGAAGTVKCNTVGDRVQYSGVGNFKDTLVQNILSPAGSPANVNPLSFIVGDTTTNRGLLSASWDGLTNATMGQVDPTYPRFECRTALGSTTCQEEVTETLTITLKGPDTAVFTSGIDKFSALCNAQDETRLTRLFTLITKVVNFLDVLERHKPNAKLREAIDKAKAFLVNFNSPPSDPQCPGAKLITAQLEWNALLDQTAATAVGAGAADPEPSAPPHFYAVINSPGLTWDQARDAAANLGNGCKLATITSADEQSIINGLLPDPSGFDGTQDYWIGGKQPSGSTEPGDNWQWIDEEDPFWNNGPTGMFANWGTSPPGPDSEPNEFQGNGEDRLTVDSRYLWGWNDLPGTALNTEGYITEGSEVLCLPPVIN